MTVRYVDNLATGAKNGTSWVNAYSDLQTALDAASPFDELWLKDNGTTNPYTDVYVVNTNDLRIYGGFAGTETSLTQRDILTHPARFIRNSSGIFQHSDPVTIYDGLLFDLLGVSSFAGSGGAIYAGGPVIVRNCIFLNCPAAHGGGALDIGSGSIVENCYFKGCSVVFSGPGGAIRAISATPSSRTIIRNCAFFNNTCKTYGGAVYCEDNTLIKNCLFVENSSSSSTGTGGGLHYNIKVYGAEYGESIVNNTFYKNSAPYGGGLAVYGPGSNSIDLVNNIIWNNYNPSAGYGHEALIYVSVNLLYNDIGNRTNSGYFKAPTVSLETNTITTDPLFLNPSIGSPTSGRFDLTFASPCKGSGKGLLDRGVINNVIDFSGSPTSGTAPLTVAFSNQGYSLGIFRNTAQWGFGDSTTLLNTDNPTHVYSSAGAYNVGFCGTTVAFCGVHYDPIYNSAAPSYNSFKLKNNYITVAAGDPPVAAISPSSVSTVGMPCTLTFNDVSTGGPVTTRSWSDGRGNTGTGTSFGPLTFTENGTFTVTLTVSNASGSSSATVSVGVRPVASFTKSATTIVTGESITFDASSSYVHVDTYSWDFDDGTPVQNVSNPIISHQYTDAGIYDATLRVLYKGIASLFSYSTISVTYPPPPPGVPVVSFNISPTSGYPNTTNFNFSGSAVYSGPIHRWEWDFGDSSAHVLSQNASHTFSGNRNYNVTLSATHLCGEVTKVGTLTKTVPVKPKAFFSPSSQVTINAGNSVSFDGTGSGITVTGWSWNFNDGPTQSGSTVSHTFTVAGTYSVTLVVTGPDGLTDSLTRTNLVVVNPIAPPPPNAPSAAIIATPSSGNVPLTVVFQGVEQEGPVTTREWDFGDGSAHSFVRDVTHVYTSNKNYTVRYTLTGPGGSNYAEKVISVRPKASFIASPLSVLVGDPVTFNGTGSTVTITNWDWTYGDNTYGTGATASKTYDAPGTYDVTLKVTGTDGLIDNVTQTSLITVFGKVSANFTFTPITGKNPLDVTFTDSSTGSPTAWAWDFGNGDTATTQGPHTITYDENGVYTITLTVTGAGPSNTSTKTATISIKPKANFIYTPTSGPSPLTVVFTDASSTNITSWDWDFGDGIGMSSLQSPTYQYLDEAIGDVNVRLTVTGPGGSDTITLGPITVEFPGDAYYVDLNINTAGGIGTPTDPLNYTEFVNATDNSLPYKIRGARLLSETDPYNVYKIGFSLDAWDYDLYGPWRIKASDPSQEYFTLNVSDCSNLILETELVNEDGSAGLILGVSGIVKTSHIRVKDKCVLNVIGNATFRGSNIIAEDSNLILNYEGMYKTEFGDCFMDVRDIGVTGSISGAQFSIQHSVCNHGGMNRFGSEVAGIASYTGVQFGYDNPEEWPAWDAGVTGGGLEGLDPDPTKWVKWSIWGKRVVVGSGNYSTIPSGPFEEARLGIGDFYFDAQAEETASLTKDAFINVLDRGIKTCTKFVGIGWVKNPLVAEDHVLYPMVVSDPYGDVLDTNASFKLEIKKEGTDYRLQYSGSKSKLIYKTLDINLDDDQWHFLSYVCLDDDGHMIYYIDGEKLEAEDGIDDEGLEFSIARSKAVRLGGGNVYCPYLYETNTGINMYNWRVGIGFTIHQEWIKDLMNIDGLDLEI